MYIKPSLQFRGGHVFGHAEDDNSQCARTILALMVKTLLGGPTFIARLIPIFKLNSSYLKQQLEKLADVISSCGGKVLALIGDNHMINRQMYKSLRYTNESYKGCLSNNDDVVLLHDPVHLIKSIRNNWLTEGRNEIRFTDPDNLESDSQIAKWKDIVSIFDQEKDNTVHTTTLTFQACHPTSFDRQKVSLVNAVFNDKVVTALSIKEKTSTACFVKQIVRLWKILNVKRPNLHLRLNDPDRSPFYSTDDDRLHFLNRFISSLSLMSGGRGLIH